LATDVSKLPQLEVIYGPMFSGKSYILLKRLGRAERQGRSVIAMRPAIDTRVTRPVIWSRRGLEHPALLLSSPATIVDAAVGVDVVGLDEAQFLDEGVVTELTWLCRQGARVLVAGLELDFRGEPFGPIPRLLQLAGRSTHLLAKCAVCGRGAEMTQRLIDGEPAPRLSPTLLIGDRELYEPRCIRCHVVT